MKEPIAEEVEKYIDILEEERKKVKPIDIKKKLNGKAKHQMKVFLKTALYTYYGLPFQDSE